VGSKRSACLYIDGGVLKTARRMGLNVSKVSENALKEYLATRRDNLPKLFRISDHTFVKIWKEAYKKTRVKITPQVLRAWFCDEMGRLGARPLRGRVLRAPPSRFWRGGTATSRPRS